MEEFNEQRKGESKEEKLPINGRRNMLITSALPYVNNVPHLGNIIGSVLSADVFARFCRLRGYNVLFVCGTDEYGTTTEVRASQENLTPAQICDKYHVLHKEIYNWFDISFDQFGRTTSDHHTDICHQVFRKIYDNNLFSEQTIEQLYCCNCAKFLADSLVEGQCPNPNCFHLCKGDQCENCGAFIKARELKNPKCKICQTLGPSLRPTKHLFLQLPSLKEELCAHVHRFQISSPEAVATTWKLLDGDDNGSSMEPKCITRDLKWGVPVPLENFSHKVLYVWFDAPLGYVSITKSHTSEWEQWWKNPGNVELHQFMGKDNVPFHTVLFPSMLIGTRESWTLPTSINATQFLLFGSGKFSKSKGIGIFGDDVKESGIPVEVWRYYLISIRPEVSDTVFSWEDLQAKLNSELADNLGNFINRVLTFVAKPPGKGYGSIIPEASGAVIEDLDVNLAATIGVHVQEYFEALEKAKLKRGLEIVMKISHAGNQYFQGNKVWELYKVNNLRCSFVIKTLTGVVCILAYLLEPFMPSVTEELLKQLNLLFAEISLVDERGDITVAQRPWDIIPSGHTIGNPRPLFRKLKDEDIEALKSRFSGSHGDSDVGTAAASTPKLLKKSKFQVSVK